jgi:hypothetical protein
MNDNAPNVDQSLNRQIDERQATTPINDSGDSNGVSSEMSRRVADWLEFLAVFHELAVRLCAMSLYALFRHSPCAVVQQDGQQARAEAEIIQLPVAPDGADKEEGAQR